MIHCKRNVKFEFESSSNSVVHAISRIFGGGDKEGSKAESTSDEYEEATAEDIDMLANFLSGGA